MSLITKTYDVQEVQDKLAATTKEVEELKTHQDAISTKLTIDEDIETAADPPLDSTSRGDDAVANSVELVTESDQSSNERDDATPSPDTASLSQSSSASSLETTGETANLPAPSELELPSPSSGISTMMLGTAALGVGTWDDEEDDAMFVPRGFTTSIAEQPLVQADEQLSISSMDIYPSEAQHLFGVEPGTLPAANIPSPDLYAQKQADSELLSQEPLPVEARTVDEVHLFPKDKLGIIVRLQAVTLQEHAELVDAPQSTPIQENITNAPKKIDFFSDLFDLAKCGSAKSIKTGNTATG
jgi:hypothetical protein